MTPEVLLGIAIAAVKVVVDIIKAAAPTLQGRWTQIIVLVLSIAAGLLIFRGMGFDVPAYVQTILAIFGGAVAADQVLKKEP